ncbi:hypothetical protein HPB48_009596 [Haemaphysalis longicornis]|uniref:Uncharacterized protein n=1 Tax=Haemaphysalis longicornis TaxID=44386 RepID=A0A9J6FVD5_HAELO|nr:hypothetical protein HPB48_009596 [Haemaphysalis longicornis]
MELEGLKRSLMFLEDHGVAVELIVTDRHAQIKCLLRKEKQSIRHEFDVWHVAKAAWLSRARAVIKSVSNHLYWSAASSRGCHEMIVAKWQSLLNPIRGVHTHDSSLFPSCVHGKLTAEEHCQVTTEMLTGQEDCRLIARMMRPGVLIHPSTEGEYWGQINQCTHIIRLLCFFD